MSCISSYMSSTAFSVSADALRVCFNSLMSYALCRFWEDKINPDRQMASSDTISVSIPNGYGSTPSPIHIPHQTRWRKRNRGLPDHSDARSDSISTFFSIMRNNLMSITLFIVIATAKKMTVAYDYFIIDYPTINLLLLELVNNSCLCFSAINSLTFSI